MAIIWIWKLDPSPCVRPFQRIFARWWWLPSASAMAGVEDGDLIEEARQAGNRMMRIQWKNGEKVITHPLKVRVSALWLPSTLCAIRVCSGWDFVYNESRPITTQGHCTETFRCSSTIR